MTRTERRRQVVLDFLLELTEPATERQIIGQCDLWYGVPDLLAQLERRGLASKRWIGLQPSDSLADALDHRRGLLWQATAFARQGAETDSRPTTGTSSTSSRRRRGIGERSGRRRVGGRSRP